MKDAVMMTEDREGEELCRPLDPYGHCWPWEKEQGIAHGSDISQWLQCGDVPVDYFRSRLIFYSSSHAPHYYSKCNSRLMSWRIVTSVLRLGQKKSAMSVGVHIEALGPVSVFSMWCTWNMLSAQLHLHCVPKNVHLFIFQVPLSKVNRF